MIIKSYLAKTKETIDRLCADASFVALFDDMASLLVATFSADRKVLFAGNGGSAADCQHLVGELVGRFRKNRPALPAIALTVDTSVLTACLNDFGPEPVFSRQVEALGREGDVLWAFSTSGRSPNILHACDAAKKRGMRVIGFTCGTGGDLPALCDLCFIAPTDVTSHAQECHISVGHALCLAVEELMFAES